eukprot:TRINITY_DN66401_c0_g1_i6.p2 TRINITY_DN66401_c0_g1~~TRINITY_DN66401_c0_g1_i6.p2  ORF type:complete len:120 (-),score=19.02 TRINITY_DN66401_c0_g1_i6:47-406(-)
MLQDAFVLSFAGHHSGSADTNKVQTTIHFVAVCTKFAFPDRQPHTVDTGTLIQRKGHLKMQDIHELSSYIVAVMQPPCPVCGALQCNPMNFVVPCSTHLSNCQLHAPFRPTTKTVVLSC